MKNAIVLRKIKTPIVELGVRFSYKVTFRDENVGEIYIHESQSQCSYHLEDMMTYVNVYGFHDAMSKRLYENYITREISIVILSKYVKVLNSILNKLLGYTDDLPLENNDVIKLNYNNLPEANVHLIIYLNSDYLIDLTLHERGVPYEEMVRDSNGDIYRFTNYTEALNFIKNHYKMEQLTSELRLRCSDLLER